MSITWLALVLPATFAEVIGLSLVTPGENGYLHVQIYTGCMFLVAFICRKSPSILHKSTWCLLGRENKYQAILTTIFSFLVWALRVYKLYLLKASGLSPESRERDAGGRNPDVVSLAESGVTGLSSGDKLSLNFVMKACFTVTKV